MKRTMKELEEALQKDENLRNEFEKQCQKVSEGGACATDAEVIVKAAETLGWTLDLNELEREKASGEELDLEELDKVSGGGEDTGLQCWYDYRCDGNVWHNVGHEDEYGHSEHCASVVFHCYITFMHTESEDEHVACWNDYRCVMNSRIEGNE